MALDFFKLVDIFFEVRVPYDGAILQCGSDECEVSGETGFLRAV